MSGPGVTLRPRLAKLALLVALALGGQFVARWIAGRYVVGLSSRAQDASLMFEWLVLACVPLGWFAAPTLSISPTPLLDRWMRREPAGSEFNRALYRSLVLVAISLGAGMLLLMFPHLHTQSGDATLNTPIPLPYAMLLAVVAPFREEVEFRLGLLTLLAWILFQLMRPALGARTRPALAIANLMQAMLFGALHQLAGFTGRTATLSLVGVMLEPRTLSGVVFGYGYIRYGLEVAIMTHMMFDGAISAAGAIFPRT